MNRGQATSADLAGRKYTNARFETSGADTIAQESHFTVTCGNSTLLTRYHWGSALPGSLVTVPRPLNIC